MKNLYFVITAFHSVITSNYALISCLAYLYCGNVILLVMLIKGHSKTTVGSFLQSPVAVDETCTLFNGLLNGIQVMVCLKVQPALLP